MRQLTRAVAGIVILGLGAGVFAGPNANHRLVVRLFKIAGDQSFESTLPDGRGGRISLHASGGVNAQFPYAVVFFPTELAANASTAAIVDAIMESVVFGCNGLVAKSIQADHIKDFELELGKDHPSAEGRFEEKRGEGRTSDYRVTADFLSEGQGRAVVRIRLDVGWSAQFGSLGTGISGAIVSAPFEIPESKLLLIGGRSWERPSAAVYWLAVSVLPQ